MTSNSSPRSCSLNCRTRAPRFGNSSTSPSDASTFSASRKRRARDLQHLAKLAFGHAAAVRNVAFDDVVAQPGQDFVVQRLVFPGGIRPGSDRLSTWRHWESGVSWPEHTPRWAGPSIKNCTQFMGCRWINRMQYVRKPDRRGTMTSTRDAIFCKFPAQARCRIACSAPWTCRSSTIAAPSSPNSARRCSKAARRSSRPRAGDHLSLLGHRRLGSGDRQYAVAGRQGADGRDRPFRDAVAADGGALGHRGRFHARRLAPRRRPRRDRGQAGAGQGACHQGGHGGAQRDLHRRHQPDRRDPRRDGQGRPSRAAAGGYDFLARLGRLTGTTSGRSTSP